jgi:hypothetical protein
MRNLAITNTPEEYRDIMVFKNEGHNLKGNIEQVKAEILLLEERLNKMESKLASISEEEGELVERINSRIRN